MRRQSRFLLMLLASLLVISGCGSEIVIEDEPATTMEPPVAATEAPTTTSEADTTSTEAAESTTTVPTTTAVARPPLLDGPLAPDLTFELDDHSTLRLSEAYEPVVVFFWATWCHNCHEMMPPIDQMASDLESRATVVAVARQSTLNDVETDVIEYLPSGATRWALDEDSSVSEAFRVPGNPVTIIVVGGVEVQRWLGSAAVSDIQIRLEEILALYG